MAEVPIARAMAELNERFFGNPEIPLSETRPADPTPIGTNKATAGELIKLLVELDELTEQLVEADRKRWVVKECKLPPVSPIPCPQLISERYMRGELEDTETRELRAWRARLDYYLAITNEAAGSLPNSREIVLYETTAPLLLGWHFFDTIPIDVLEDGYRSTWWDPVSGPGHWFDVQHLPDAMTPLVLADALGIDLEFARTNDMTEGLKSAALDWAGDVADVLGDIRKGAETLAKSAAVGVGIAALIGLGVVLALRD